MGYYTIYFRQGYVHRDLKLDNIMFIKNDSEETKIIDFGFAEKINYD